MIREAKPPRIVIYGVGQYGAAGLDEAVIRRRMAGYFALLESLKKQAMQEVP